MEKYLETDGRIALENQHPDFNLTFESVTTNIGAIVHGVSVHDDPAGNVASVLRRALHEHGVLFVHSQSTITDEEFLAFGTMFGERLPYPYGGGDGQKPPDILRFDLDDGSKAIEYRLNAWHTDGTSQETPPQAALLSPSILPRVGGDTMWASTTAAYDALSSHYQRLLEDMEALHSTAVVEWYFRQVGNSTSGRRAFGDGESCVHPLVVTDPVTKRKALYVNSVYTERIIGLTESESRRLLQVLYDHVNTPEFHVRLRWRPNMIAVWEERITQHRAVADFTGRRDLRRITIRGDRPRA
jgi:taurine dioxygenase